MKLLRRWYVWPTENEVDAYEVASRSEAEAEVLRLRGTTHPEATWATTCDDDEMLE